GEKKERGEEREREEKRERERELSPRVRCVVVNVPDTASIRPMQLMPLSKFRKLIFFLHTHARTHTNTHPAHTRTHAHTHRNGHIQTDIRHTHTHTHTQKWTHIHTDIRHTHTHTHTEMDTHTGRRI